jgi:hypothetical protein
VLGINGVITGDYRIGVTTGLTTGLSANDPIFSFRWGSTTHRCAIRALQVAIQIVTPFTAANEVSANAIFARTFTASDTGGTALTLTGTNANLHSYSSTASKVTDARVATTGTLTAGTRTLDSQPFLQCLAGQLLAAAGAAQGNAAADYDTIPDRHPIVLTTNEGIIVRSGIALGAAGTVRFAIGLEWSEYLNESS